MRPLAMVRGVNSSWEDMIASRNKSRDLAMQCEINAGAPLVVNYGFSYYSSGRVISHRHGDASSAIRRIREHAIVVVDEVVARPDPINPMDELVLSDRIRSGPVGNHRSGHESRVW